MIADQEIGENTNILYYIISYLELPVLQNISCLLSHVLLGEVEDPSHYGIRL